MLRRQKILHLASIVAITCVTALFVGNAVGQEKMEYVGGNGVKMLLFKDANTMMKAAKDVQADVLAPKNFGDAMKHYRDAETDLKKGKNIDDIRKNLRQSSGYFQKAIDATKLAEVTFPNSMKARNDAQYTEAAKYSPELWKDAEKKFNDAAGELEDGDVNKAKAKAGDAETLYRKAELASIKTNYLDATRVLLKQADELKTRKYAPKTLQLAQQLVKQAEKELNQNRYDTDVARNLALQANYQARHAIYLGKTIQQMDDKKQTWEDLMLNSEKPLQRIAEQTGQLAKFDTGPDETTDAIVTYINTYQDSATGMSQDLAGLEQHSSLLNARVTELEQQVGSQEKQKSALAAQIVNEAKTRESFAKVERSFRPGEARVLREGNDIILRLVGLNFPSNEATIEQKSFGLLTKVRTAIDNFPESTISVMGYTDSFGSDEQNLKLSIDRANAVKEYLLANSDLAASKVTAIGYGESKPITTNDTAAGRATNRRVDVIIHPWAGDSRGLTDLSK